MISVMLISENEREKQILSMAFEQYNMTVFISRPDYANYIKAVQYMPDAVFIEMPRLNTEHFRFIQALKKHHKAKKTPIVGYGDKRAPGFIRGMRDVGLDKYLERPIKFSLLLQIVEQTLKGKSKTIIDPCKKRDSEKESDLALIMDSRTLPTKKTELMVKHISDLLAFPFTAAKILQLTASEKSGASDLSKVIEADPVIATNLLKFSNTVFFAGLNRRISSIKDAVVRIGFSETKRIVMSMSVMNLFSTESNNCGFDRVRFWYHCLAGAVMAEKAARHMGTINSEEAFLAGLLHDFGIILLDEFFPSLFRKILGETTDEGGHFIASELDTLSISHIDVVKELFTHWKLPQQITEGIVRYLDVYESDLDIGGEGAGAQIAICTALGNAAAKAYGIGAACDEFVFPIENWAFRRAKMPSGFARSHIKNMHQEINLYRQFLKLDEEASEGYKRELASEPMNIGIVNPARSIFIPPETLLQSIGHRTVRVPVADSYDSYHERFDMLLYWPGRDTTLEEIEAVSSILPRPGLEKNAEKTLPLITFFHEDSPLSEQKSKLPGRSFSTAFDLRRIEEFLHQQQVEKE